MAIRTRSSRKKNDKKYIYQNKLKIQENDTDKVKLKTLLFQTNKIANVF